MAEGEGVYRPPEAGASTRSPEILSGVQTGKSQEAPCKEIARPREKATLPNIKIAWGNYIREIVGSGGELKPEELDDIDELMKKGKGPVAGGTTFSGRSATNRPVAAPYRLEIGPQDPNSVDGWMEAVLGTVFEQYENINGKLFQERISENLELSSIVNGLDAMPEDLKLNFVTVFRGAGLGYERQVPYQEALKSTLWALCRIRNRKVEIESSKGSLAVMGVVSPEVQAQTTIKFTNLTPEDHWTITHLDEIFPFVSNTDAKIPVSAALNEWKAAGEAYTDPYRGTISFKDAIQSDAYMAYFKAQIENKLVDEDHYTRFQARWATELAGDYLTCNLTMSMWDKEREQHTTIGEDRDLMHFEYKRRNDFMKGDPAGPDITVGAYWAAPEQDNIATYGGWPREGRAKDMAKRRIDILKKNKTSKAVFVFNPADVTRAEIVGDFFRSVQVADAGQPRRLSDYTWKQMPFWQLEPTQYAGYFGYDLAFANTIVSTFKERGQDLKKLVDPGYWDSMHKLINRVTAFCPTLLRVPPGMPDTRASLKEFQEATLDKMRFNYILGVFWCGSPEAVPDNPINPYKRAYWTNQQVRAVLQAMKQGNFLSRNSTVVLESEVLKMYFGRYAQPK